MNVFRVREEENGRQTRDKEACVLTPIFLPGISGGLNIDITKKTIL
jgi:hypothetical protein